MTVKPHDLAGGRWANTAAAGDAAAGSAAPAAVVGRRVARGGPARRAGPAR